MKTILKYPQIETFARHRDCVPRPTIVHVPTRSGMSDPDFTAFVA